MRRVFLAFLGLTICLLLSACACTALDADGGGRQAAEDYLARELPGSDFQVSLFFNLFGQADRVYMKAVSASSPDTWFYLEYIPETGQLRASYDDGMAETTSGGHTLSRLEAEMGRLVFEQIESAGVPDPPHCQATVTSDFFSAWYAGEIKLDDPLSPELPLIWSLSFQFNMETGPRPDFESTADLLSSIAEAADGTKYQIDQFQFGVTCFGLDAEDKTVWYTLTRRELADPGLSQRLEQIFLQQCEQPLIQNARPR